MRRSVFLDRDGVIIKDNDLITERQQIALYPYAPAAIERLRHAGYQVIVVTNQPVIARGLISEQGVEVLHDWLQQLLYAANRTQIDRFFFCPHHPNATVAKYRCDCECRKPKPGMLLQAAKEFDLDLTDCYMVGDRISDIAAGQRAGCRTIWVQTGMHEAPAIQSAEPASGNETADFICTNLSVAAEYIVSNTR